MNNEFYKIGVQIALSEVGLVKEARNPSGSQRLMNPSGTHDVAGKDMQLLRSQLKLSPKEPALTERLQRFKSVKTYMPEAGGSRDRLARIMGVTPDRVSALAKDFINPRETGIVPHLPEGGGRLTRKGVPLLESLGYKARGLMQVAKRHPVLSGLAAAGTLGLGGLGLHSALKED